MESEVQLKESGIQLTTGIQNPSSTDKDQDPYLESGIQGVESRIQDCLGLPYYMVRQAGSFLLPHTGLLLKPLSDSHNSAYECN